MSGDCAFSLQLGVHDKTASYSVPLSFASMAVVERNDLNHALHNSQSGPKHSSFIFFFHLDSESSM